MADTAFDSATGYDAVDAEAQSSAPYVNAAGTEFDAPTTADLIGRQWPVVPS